MVVFENTTKVFGDNVVIQNLNLTIDRGRFAVLIGPSGCGKTTSLRIINRLIEPTEGIIMVGGQDISKVNPVDLRRSIGYVIQQIGLFPNMTIEQNIEVVPKLLGWTKVKRRERVGELLEMVGMNPSEYRTRYPSELSGGQQQRVGVLRALAVSPPLLLMDEPFGALDPITRETLQDELKKLQSDLGITIVFVTHDIDEAVKLADVIVLMKDGKIVQSAPPKELLANPASNFVREFIGKKRLKACRCCLGGC
jgi:osmoprotectant transport system ATP-binding protein